MKNAFSLEQIAKAADLNADLIMRLYMLDKATEFMEIKSNNPKLKQSEIAKQLAIPTSTLQRYRREINKHSPYRILQLSNTHTGKQKALNHTEQDLRMTSNDLKVTSKETDESNRKKKLKDGSSNNVDSTEGRNLIEQAFPSQ